MREVKGQQFFHCFEFDDDAVFDQKVDSIAGFDVDALIHHWETNLVLEMQTIHSKLMMQTRTVCAFEPGHGMVHIVMAWRFWRCL